uniref:Uncharacterized protein n=1 Tax=Timema monikensis TaxID=170555 RepID=A0A7R9E3S7_9NEOP|nr:unnamed protein product [Timema monikensis]
MKELGKKKTRRRKMFVHPINIASRFEGTYYNLYEKLKLKKHTASYKHTLRYQPTQVALGSVVLRSRQHCDMKVVAGVERDRIRLPWNFNWPLYHLVHVDIPVLFDVCNERISRIKHPTFLTNVVYSLLFSFADERRSHLPTGRTYIGDPAQWPTYCCSQVKNDKHLTQGMGEGEGVMVCEACLRMRQIQTIARSLQVSGRSSAGSAHRLPVRNAPIHSYGGIGFGIKREIFFLNLEDGYFGCQVNESTDVLQLYELSKLCDGTSDCFMASDELTKELKCTNLWQAVHVTLCSRGHCPQLLKGPFETRGTKFVFPIRASLPSTSASEDMCRPELHFGRPERQKNRDAFIKFPIKTEQELVQQVYSMAAQDLQPEKLDVLGPIYSTVREQRTLVAPSRVEHVAPKPLDKRITGTRNPTVGLHQRLEVVLDSHVENVPGDVPNNPQTLVLECLQPPYTRVRQVASSGTRMHRPEQPACTVSVCSSWTGRYGQGSRCHKQSGVLNAQLALPVEHPPLRRECVGPNPSRRMNPSAHPTCLLRGGVPHEETATNRESLLRQADCDKEDGVKCQNGACLDSQCHCNDGFGGCSCEVPDQAYISASSVRLCDEEKMDK